jgi:carboxyl-terminal processing protease
VLITGLVIGAYGAGVGSMWLLTHGRTASAEEEAAFGVFWEAWHLVEDNFLGDLPDMQHLSWGAIRGALTTLDDPHTSFLEPQPRQREKERLEGEFGGIGAYVSQAEDGSIILDPMPDLPAEQAGVQKGDAVIKVDDTDITPEMTVDDVVNIVRGEVGTIVRLTLNREGASEPFVVEIERQEIPTPSVEWRMLEEADGLGYVRIMIFGGRTVTELVDALEQLQDQGMTGLVLDLRGNGGGFLDAATDVASEFLQDGVVLYQVAKDKPEQPFKVKGGGIFVEPPLVLLVDGGTASASEIVAGALQDHGRAALIGEKTYGKGSVQSVFDLSDGSSVHITSARWLTPNRHQIDGEGLTPDLEVTVSDEERSQERDPQLERAIEYLANGR